LRDVQDIIGIRELWRYSKGHPSVRIAVLDGPIDHHHPCFVGSRLTPLDFGGSRLQRSRASKSHGTAVSGLIFSEVRGDVQGIGPKCTGITADIFSFDRAPEPPQCTEPMLAYAIGRALQYNVDVINISGGFDARNCSASLLLRSVLDHCSKRGTLVVSSVSNTGLKISSVPACLPNVLAVGSEDANGFPSRFSSFDSALVVRGILAPGEGLLCAAPDGKTAVRSGTSYAAAIVSGVVAVLLAVARSLKVRMSALHIGDLLLETASACPIQPGQTRMRCLAGRLNTVAALERVIMLGGKVGRQSF
jgi:subtilisin family serine protease